MDGLGFPPCSEVVRPGGIPPSLDGVEGVESMVAREIGIGPELPFGPKLEPEDNPFGGNSLSVAREETCLS